MTRTRRPAVRFLALLFIAALFCCTEGVRAQTLPHRALEEPRKPPAGEEPAAAPKPEAPAPSGGEQAAAPPAVEEPAKPPAAEEAAPAAEEPAPAAKPEAPAPGGSEQAAQPPAAEEPPNFGIGIGMAVLLLPEDSDFVGASSPLDLFLDWDTPLDWLKIRAGYNTGVKSEARVGSNNMAKLTSTSLYGALRLVRDITPQLRAVMLGGAALINSELESSDGSFSQGDSGLGLLLGAGALYRVQRWGIGAQFVVLSREGNFEGVKIFAGSNQVQVIAILNF